MNWQIDLRLLRYKLKQKTKSYYCIGSDTGNRTPV